jgi:hypothetical protein
LNILSLFQITGICVMIIVQLCYYVVIHNALKQVKYFY